MVSETVGPFASVKTSAHEREHERERLPSERERERERPAAG